MAVTGAVLRSAYIQYSRILSNQILRTGTKDFARRCQQSTGVSFFKRSQKCPNICLRCFSTSSIIGSNSPVTEPATVKEWSHASDSSLGKDITNKVELKLTSEDLGRLFAVIQVGGKQRKVTAEDVIVVEHFFPPTVGEKIRLEKVLMVGSKDFTIVGQPILSREQVYVEATVIEKTLSHFKAVFHYIPRKGHRKFKLKRTEQTMLVVNKIQVKQVTS